jgi:hypothetical protein
MTIPSFARALLPACTIAVAPACAAHSQGAGRAAHVDTLTEEDAPVTRTARFELYSRFEFNLHDRLRQWAVLDDRSGAACLAGVSNADREGWDRAVTAFQALRPDVVPPRLELRLRYALFRPDDGSMDESLGVVPTWYRPALAAGGSAYRRCWWQDDDRRNRDWIVTLTARLIRSETDLARRLEAAHRVSLPTERIPIDVVPTVDYSGANTVVHPHHILMSSTQPGYGGFGGLELVFHEASHTVVNPGSDGSSAALRHAAEKQGVPLPRDLWHVVLFFTAGDATKKTVREIWGEPYQQYLYGSGLFQRAWPQWREPLERAWQPYLDGRTSLEAAASELVAAVAQKR